MTAPRPLLPAGLLSALGAHVFWGSMPLYLLLVKHVPALEFVAWRTLFTLPVCLVAITWSGAWPQLRAVLRDGRAMRTLLGSAAMVASNWFIYVWAIQAGHVYAASLGYYILPLMMMMLGFLVLGERLSRIQWAAAALAGAGVTALALGALTTLWVSLGLAVTFGIYGLLRKTVAAGPLVGLAVESLLLAPLGAGLVGWSAMSEAGSALGRDTFESVALAASGLMTAIPLILFARAARAMPYTVIGFLQFISPTVVFILGLTVFGEDLRPAQLACFVAIWVAVALFTWELLRGRRPAARRAPSKDDTARGAAV